ncbi:MAG TPA: peptide deformylase, partial [Candidatus Binataceae bacterium]
PDPVLKEPARQVRDIDGRINALADSMVLTMYAAPGIGLAAPQIGESRRLVVIDIDHQNPGKRLLKLVNPQIIEREGSITWEEGCLSVVDYNAEVKRSAKVLVRAWTPEQVEIDVEADGLLAVVLQHEIDHLDGKLFIDRISRIKRELYRRKLQKALKEGKTDGERPSSSRF